MKADRKNLRIKPWPETVCKVIDRSRQATLGDLPLLCPTQFLRSSTCEARVKSVVGGINSSQRQKIAQTQSGRNWDTRSIGACCRIHCASVTSLAYLWRERVTFEQTVCPLQRTRFFFFIITCCCCCWMFFLGEGWEWGGGRGGGGGQPLLHVRCKKQSPVRTSENHVV